jgi:hypothetical protein
MNTTLQILQGPTFTHDERSSLFNGFKKAYYNDEITYEELEAYTELLYGTTHRAFGDRPAEAPIHVPALDEGFSKSEIEDFSELYITAFDLYLYRDHIDYDTFKNLFPIRKDTAARIRAYSASFAGAVGLNAVAAAL